MPIIRSTHRRFRRGTSLIEAMVALSVTGMAIATFATAFPFASNNISRARQSDIASNACQQQLEGWRDVGYSALPLPSGASTASHAFAAPATLNAATGTVTFTRVTDAMAATFADTGSIRVDATVTWNGSGRDGGKVTLTSLVVQ